MSDELRDEPSIERVADLYSWAYAWRSRDGDDDTDLSALRKRNRAEFDRALDAEVARRVAEAKAEAWDEGERHESEYLRMFGQFCHNPQNPYRAASIETGGEK